jgi:hypothetical protein
MNDSCAARSINDHACGTYRRLYIDDRNAVATDFHRFSQRQRWKLEPA